MNIIKDDIFNTKEEVIAHCVNCQGAMGAGIALQIKQKYPEVFEQYAQFIKKQSNKIIALGECQLVHVEDKWIANLFGQLNYGKQQRFLNYEAFYSSLEKLLYQMNKNQLNSIAFPYLIGCGNAGGDWDIVSTMINTVFNNTGKIINFYKK